MLGPIGAHLMAILRVMTPSEIDRYANASDKRKVSAVAAGAEDFSLENSQSGASQSHSGGFKRMTEAEIIPIRPDQKNKESPHHNQSKTPQGENSSNDELEKVGIFSKHKVDEMRRHAEELAKSSEDSSSVFLLKQRERLKRTNSKMVGNAALKTYVETAHADMTQAEVDLENPEDELAQGSKGILINKKHF